MEIELYYDKECPFCNHYATFIKLKQEHNLLLFNAREEKKRIEEFKNLGFDINNGYIIKIDNIKILQGVDAIVFINNIAEKKIFFKDNFIFRNFIYKVIKLLRVVILKMARVEYKL